MSGTTESGAVPVSVTLEQDHREIDARFATFGAALGSGTVDEAAFRAGSEGLRQHIWVEEQFHFPPLRSAGIFGPILVMLREHGEIWDLLDGISAALAAGSAAPALVGPFGRLEALLENHNVKEEQILYPAGDAQLDEDVAAQIRQALTDGQRPTDWSCEQSVGGRRA